MSKYRSYTLKGVQAPTDFPEQVSDLEENRITAGLRIGVAEVKQDLSKRYWDHAAQTYLVSRPTPIGDTEWWLVEYVKHRLIRIMPSTRTGQRPLNGPSYEAESLARAVYLLGCSDHIWRGSNPLAFESTSVMRTLESLVIALHDAIGLVPCEIQVRKLHQGTNSVEMSLVLDNASATAVELTITLTFNRAHNRWYSKVKHAVETWTMWQLMSYGKLLQEIGEAVERWADLSPPKD